MEINQSSRGQLALAIREGVEAGRFEDIFFVLNCIKIDPVYIGRVLSDNIGQPDIAVEQLVSAVDSRVGRDEFFAGIQDDMTDQEVRLDFERWEYCLFAQLEVLIAHASTNRATIELNFIDLQRAKMRLRHDEEWNQVLRDFAAAEFIGPRVQHVIDSCALRVRTHAAQRHLNDLPGRFAWQSYAMLEAAGSQKAISAFRGDGLDYEQHIAAIIKRHVPNAVVTVTKASGDQGADILFEAGQARIVIQTKLYTRPVGNDAVQQVYAAKRFYSATAAVVVTNSTYTLAAEELAESLQVILLHEDDIGALLARAYA